LDLFFGFVANETEFIAVSVKELETAAAPQ